MKKIEIFGPGCPKCAALYELTQLLLKENNSSASVEKVMDAMEMGNRDILSVPALAIDGKVVFSGRVPSKSELLNILLENGLSEACECSCKGDSLNKDCSCGDDCKCGDSCKCGDDCKCKSAQEVTSVSSCCCCGSKGGAFKRALVLIIIAIVLFSAYKIMTSEGACGSKCNTPSAS